MLTIYICVWSASFHVWREPDDVPVNIYKPFKALTAPRYSIKCPVACILSAAVVVVMVIVAVVNFYR